MLDTIVYKEVYELTIKAAFAWGAHLGPSPYIYSSPVGTSPVEDVLCTMIMFRVSASSAFLSF